MAWNIGTAQNGGWDIGAAQGVAAATTYTVTYFGNGEDSGSVPVDGSSPYSEGSTVTVLENSGSLFRAGYCFDKWNTASDGSGTDYSPGETFSMPGSNVSLYVVWSVCDEILVSGTGITPFYTYLYRFAPKTKLALKWGQLADNNFFAVDRGAGSDVYESEVILIGTETKINQFITEIEANRAAGSNVISLSNFNGVDDQLFGLDVDYSGSINATIVDYDDRPQRTLNSWSFKFTIRAIAPSLTGTASLPTVTPEITYKSYTDRTVKKIDTYDGNFSYFDKGADSGIFEGVFELFLSDAKRFKRYLCSTIRGDDMTIAISGVDYPLGPNRPTGSVDVKVIDFKEEQININRWSYTLKLVEVV